MSDAAPKEKPIPPDDNVRYIHMDDVHKALPVNVATELSNAGVPTTVEQTRVQPENPVTALVSDHPVPGTESLKETIPDSFRGSDTDLATNLMHNTPRTIGEPEKIKSIMELRNKREKAKQRLLEKKAA